MIRSVCPTVFLCVGDGAARLWSLCFCARGVCSHHLMLACQSIKCRGPVSHQGSMHDCQCLDAQKFAPPWRKAPLRGKDSSVTQTTVPIHNDRCAVWLKWRTAQYRRLNSKYMWGHWQTAAMKCWSTCLVMIYNQGTLTATLSFVQGLYIDYCLNALF